MTQKYDPRRHGRTSESDPASDTVREEWEHCHRLEAEVGGVWAPTASIFLRDDLQPRIENGLDTATAQRYADAFDLLPPVTVQRGTLMLVDGRHRIRAAYLANPQRYYIKINEIDVPDEELIDYAVKANVGHGRAATTKERMFWARDFLRRHPEWANPRIAEWTGASTRTVSDMRWKLEAEAEIHKTPTRLGIDGVERKVTQAPVNTERSEHDSNMNLPKVQPSETRQNDPPPVQIARVGGTHTAPNEPKPETHSDSSIGTLSNVEGGKPAGYFPVGSAVTDMGTGHVYRVAMKANGVAQLEPVSGGAPVLVPVATPLRYRASSIVMDDPEPVPEQQSNAPSATTKALSLEKTADIRDRIAQLMDAIDGVAPEAFIAGLGGQLAWVAGFTEPVVEWLSVVVEARS